MRVVGNTSGNRVTQWTVGFRQEKVVSTGEWDGIMQYPGLHMAPQSGVPLEYIKCITFSQRAGWGPSHSIWPPVPLSFSVTKTPSSLHTAPGLASSALTSHSRWGGWYQGTISLIKAALPSPCSLRLERSQLTLWERIWESLWFRVPKVSKEYSFFEEPWGWAKMGKARPINVWAGFLDSPGSLELFAM